MDTKALKEAARVFIRGFLSSFIPALGVIFSTLSLALEEGALVTRVLLTTGLSALAASIAAGIQAVDKYYFQKSGGEQHLLPKVNTLIKD